jgi:small subunit ribosomal protein S20
MAHSSSAKKRIRRSEDQKALNRWRKQRFRSGIKSFRETILHGTVQEAETSFSALCKVIDQVAAKGSIHKNTAARYKSRLASRLHVKKVQAS